MKKTATVIMVLCAIGFSGCSNSCNNNQRNVDSRGDAQISQDTLGDTVNVDVDVDVNGNNAASSNNSGTDGTNDTNSVTLTPEDTVQLAPVSLAGWHRWPPDTNILTTNTNRHECTINSKGRMADSEGIVNEHLGTFLGGKTLVLHFSNTGASSFHGGRMIKVEADDAVILPPPSTFPVEGF